MRILVANGFAGDISRWLRLVWWWHLLLELHGSCPCDIGEEGGSWNEEPLFWMHWRRKKKKERRKEKGFGHERKISCGTPEFTHAPLCLFSTHHYLCFLLLFYVYFIVLLTLPMLLTPHPCVILCYFLACFIFFAYLHILLTLHPYICCLFWAWFIIMCVSRCLLAMHLLCYFVSDCVYSLHSCCLRLAPLMSLVPICWLHPTFHNSHLSFYVHFTFRFYSLQPTVYSLHLPMHLISFLTKLLFIYLFNLTFSLYTFF